MVAVIVRPRIEAGVPARPGVASRASATRQPRVQPGVPARASATRRPRVATGARVIACPGGIASARRAARPRVTVPARVTAWLRATSWASVTTKARVTAVQGIRLTGLYGTALDRTLAPGTLVYGPPAYGTVPPVRTPAPPARAAGIAGGVSSGITAGVLPGITGGVVGGSRIGSRAGLTSGDGPTPARVPGGFRTAVAHAPLTTPGLPPLPSRNHSIMEHRRRPPLPVRLGRSHLLRSVSPPVPCVPVTATSRPREFPERESGGDNGGGTPRHLRAARYARRQATGPRAARAPSGQPPAHRQGTGPRGYRRLGKRFSHNACRADRGRVANP